MVAAARRRRTRAVETIVVEKCIFICMLRVFRCSGIENRVLETI